MNKIKLGDVLEAKRGMSLPGEYYATEGDYIRLTLEILIIRLVDGKRMY